MASKHAAQTNDGIKEDIKHYLGSAMGELYFAACNFDMWMQDLGKDSPEIERLTALRNQVSDCNNVLFQLRGVLANKPAAEGVES